MRIQAEVPKAPKIHFYTTSEANDYKSGPKVMWLAVMLFRIATKQNCRLDTPWSVEFSADTA